MAHTYYCILGNTPSLSRLELTRLLPDQSLEDVSEQIVSIQLPDDQTASDLLHRSGGTVKILKQIAILDSVDEEQITTAIVEYLSQLPDPKITFALAELERDHLPMLSASEVKKALKAAGKKVRYQEASRHGLSAAILSHHDVTEVMAIHITNQTLLAESVAVQNIDHWTLKDRSKPYADRKKGMLPPKLARMLVNIALGAEKQTGLLLDPFCGSGTVLMEAMELDCAVLGSDTDSEAVGGAQRNLRWFGEQLESAPNWDVLLADATKVKPEQPVQYLVTEPYLGKPNPQKDQIKNIFTGLYKMYLGAFKHWRTILAPGASLVVIFPRARGEQLGMKQDVVLQQLIDKLDSLGYTTLSEPVVYHRPQAIIAREVYHLQFRGN